MSARNGYIQHLSCCASKCNGSWNRSFASFTTTPELYFYGKIQIKVAAKGGLVLVQGFVYSQVEYETRCEKKSSLQITIMKICKAQTPWLRALKKM